MRTKKILGVYLDHHTWLLCEQGCKKGACAFQTDLQAGIPRKSHFQESNYNAAVADIMNRLSDTRVNQVLNCPEYFPEGLTVLYIGTLVSQLAANLGQSRAAKAG